MMYQTCSEKWGLVNYFDALAPADKEFRARLFVGREREIRRILDYIRPLDRSVLVYGYYGIGKTMLIYEVLERLKADTSGKFITVYTTYNPEVGFKICVLTAIADVFVSRFGNQFAQGILHRLSGGEISKEYGGRNTFTEKGIVNIDQLLKELRREAEKEIEGCRIIIAVDDIERKADVALVQSMIDDIRSLRDLRFSVIVPGHPVNATKAFTTSAHGIFLEVELEQVNAQELTEIFLRHLKIGRSRPHPSAFYPFTQESVEYIVNRFANPDSTVREFIVACFHVIEESIDFTSEYITVDQVQSIWPKIGSRILAAVEREDHAIRILKLIHELGGEISEDVPYTVIDHILNKPGGFSDVIEELTDLIEGGIVTPMHDGHQMHIKLNKGVYDHETLNLILAQENISVSFLGDFSI